MALNSDARQALLAQPLTPILAIDRPGHPPIAVPVWHAYEPGGDAWIMVGAESEKARLLRAAGGATLVVQEVAPRTRYAAASCEVVDEHPATDDERRTLAERYLPPEEVQQYLDVAASFGPEVVVVLRPVAWRAADLTM
ncbi:pyridoxamine 5'-phosphate oxidase family protein [Agrococcus sp. SGAir0287]|uniref:pyridoxamine 5'-phosphate oxidase family protein n=1 Tax=Agrococcus sp. SGAir0287 TaxID=2070347 RepID=UPI0010CCE7D2|nr:pyridoxamine 5'-phosphate oxidase family protein [Agrococcus sp. SGAir0287]QCR19222.1 pyridoxamine 5-phosphate oxidase [Agrococcus sp. SGAir0287]